MRDGIAPTIACYIGLACVVCGMLGGVLLSRTVSARRPERELAALGEQVGAYWAGWSQEKQGHKKKAEMLRMAERRAEAFTIALRTAQDDADASRQRLREARAETARASTPDAAEARAQKAELEDARLVLARLRGEVHDLKTKLAERSPTGGTRAPQSGRVVPPTHGASNSAKPTVKLQANIAFTGTQFVVINKNDFTWHRVSLEVSCGGLFSPTYYYRVKSMRPGQKVTVGAMAFATGGGTRLNPFQKKPSTFLISAWTTPNGGHIAGVYGLE